MIVGQITHDRLISDVFKWVRNEFRWTNKLFFHVVNEVAPIKGESKQQHMQRLSRLKSIGLVSGVFDLLFFYRGCLYCFDGKIGKDKLGDEQLEFQNAILLQGGQCYTFSTLHEFQVIFLRILAENA